jgi:hypothetical protein
MANFSSTARLPSTTSRARADEYARLNTRKTFDGKLVARVVEIEPGRFSVFVDKNGQPFGTVPLT